MAEARAVEHELAGVGIHDRASSAQCSTASRSARSPRRRCAPRARPSAPGREADDVAGAQRPVRRRACATVSSPHDDHQPLLRGQLEVVRPRRLPRLRARRCRAPSARTARSPADGRARNRCPSGPSSSASSSHASRLTISVMRRAPHDATSTTVATARSTSSSSTRQLAEHPARSGSPRARRTRSTPQARRRSPRAPRRVPAPPR